MSSVPHGAFAALKMRKNLEESHRTDFEQAGAYKNNNTRFLADDFVLEQPPFKYNSKLMNSIWGLYNKYSVHNLKKNTDSDVLGIFKNQHL